MMRALTGAEVRQAVRGRWLSRNEPIPIRGVSIDSRTAGDGDLFVAIVGDTFDGHDFLAQAAEAGCIAAVVALSRKPDKDILGRFGAGVIGVDDTRGALLDLGAFYRSVIPARVIGVTGSNGKTTTKRMLHHVLRTRLTGTCSPKSFNNEIGVPLTILSAGAGDDYILCEVGANTLGEIARLARAIRPNIAVVTSICEAHLEGLGSVAQIAVEKAALLGWLGERDFAVVTADSLYLDRAIKSYQDPLVSNGQAGRIIGFGESPQAQLRLTAYEPDGRGQRFQINDRDWVTLSIPGRHNARNAVAAIAVCMRMGFTLQDAAAALADFPGVPMRTEWIDAGAVTVLHDGYNANPDSFLAGVGVLTDCKARRRVVIGGDMRELGSRAGELHEKIGQALGAGKVDVVIGVGELGGRIAEAAAPFGKATETFATVADAAAGIGVLLKKGDVVLLKGSRGMGMEALLPALRAAGEKLAGRKSK